MCEPQQLSAIKRFLEMTNNKKENNDLLEWEDVIPENEDFEMEITVKRLAGSSDKR